MESLDQFYKNKSQWIPKSLQTEIGHFNIFKLQPYVAGQPTKIPYQRRDFYKIMLVKGHYPRGCAFVYCCRIISLEGLYYLLW